jgi:3-hydroxyacyl-CoA dehydrogenase
MAFRAVERLASGFEALVVAAEGEMFSAGANLALVLMAAMEGEWDELAGAVHRFQQANMALKYAPKPVVVAPFSRALGGGCEVVLHAHRVQASAELYMGLVEIGVGVIPAGGGCKEMIARLKDPRRVFELIGMAKVSASADDAKDLGLLDRSAGVTMNPERLLYDARQLALSLASAYRPGRPRDDIKVGGDAAYAALRMGAWLMREAGQITEHEFTIAEKLATVLTGGRLSGEQMVSEQYLLDLEREAFLSLCGMQKTQERMKHMLDTGKALRN